MKLPSAFNLGLCCKPKLLKIELMELALERWLFLTLAPPGMLLIAAL